jgi:oligoribonuclease NrnB/cAMP/cGMP phosphodiesterase (DHH superfamily)
MPIATHGDLDGFVSALIVSEMENIVPERIHIFGYEQDRDQKWKDLLKYQLKPTKGMVDDLEPVWFVDISLRPGELEWARAKQKKSNWYWVDHHASSLNFDPDSLFQEVILNSDSNVCAADLLWEKWENEVRKPHDTLETWVDIAHDRDLWIRSNKELGMKLDILVKDNQDSWDRLITKAKTMSPSELVKNEAENWKEGMDKFNFALEVAKNTVQNIEIWDVIFRMAYTVSNESDVADFLYKNVSSVICLIIPRKEGLKISFRRKDIDVNLNELAEKFFEGGGHPYSAGGRLNERHVKGGYSSIARDIKKFMSARERIRSMKGKK